VEVIQGRALGWTNQGAPLLKTTVKCVLPDDRLESSGASTRHLSLRLARIATTSFALIRRFDNEWYPESSTFRAIRARNLVNLGQMFDGAVSAGPFPNHGTGGRIGATLMVPAWPRQGLALLRRWLGASRLPFRPNVYRYNAYCMEISRGIAWQRRLM
jgi:hypothetical protein